MPSALWELGTEQARKIQCSQLSLWWGTNSFKDEGLCRGTVWKREDKGFLKDADKTTQMRERNVTGEWLEGTEVAESQ